MTERRIIEVEGPIIVNAELAKELEVPEIIMPEESALTERRICRKCGYGFYWPPLPSDTRVRAEDMCLVCGRLGEREPEDKLDPCTIEDMLEIST